MEGKEKNTNQDPFGEVPNPALVEDVAMDGGPSPSLRAEPVPQGSDQSHAVRKTLQMFREATAAALEKRRLLALGNFSRNAQHEQRVTWEGATGNGSAASDNAEGASRLLGKTGTGNFASSALLDTEPKGASFIGTMDSQARVQDPPPVSRPSSTESGEIVEADLLAPDPTSLSGRRGTNMDPGVSGRRPDNTAYPWLQADDPFSGPALRYPLPPRPFLPQRDMVQGPSTHSRAIPPANLGVQPPQNKGRQAPPSGYQTGGNVPAKHSGEGQGFLAPLQGFGGGQEGQRNWNAKSSASSSGQIVPSSAPAAAAAAAAASTAASQNNGSGTRANVQPTTDRVANTAHRDKQDNGVSNRRVSDYGLYIKTRRSADGFSLCLWPPRETTPPPRICFMPRSAKKTWLLEVAMPPDGPTNTVDIRSGDVVLSLSPRNFHLLLQAFAYLRDRKSELEQEWKRGNPNSDIHPTPEPYEDAVPAFVPSVLAKFKRVKTFEAYSFRPNHFDHTGRQIPAARARPPTEERRLLVIRPYPIVVGYQDTFQDTYWDVGTNLAENVRPQDVVIPETEEMYKKLCNFLTNLKLGDWHAIWHSAHPGSPLPKMFATTVPSKNQAVNASGKKETAEASAGNQNQGVVEALSRPPELEAMEEGQGTSNHALPTQPNITSANIESAMALARTAIDLATRALSQVGLQPDPSAAQRPQPTPARGRLNGSRQSPNASQGRRRSSPKAKYREPERKSRGKIDRAYGDRVGRGLPRLSVREPPLESSRKRRRETDSSGADSQSKRAKIGNGTKAPARKFPLATSEKTVQTRPSGGSLPLSPTLRSTAPLTSILPPRPTPAAHPPPPGLGFVPPGLFFPPLPPNHPSQPFGAVFYPLNATGPIESQNQASSTTTGQSPGSEWGRKRSRRTKNARGVNQERQGQEQHRPAAPAPRERSSPCPAQ